MRLVNTDEGWKNKKRTKTSLETYAVEMSEFNEECEKNWEASGAGHGGICVNLTVRAGAKPWITAARQAFVSE